MKSHITVILANSSDGILSRLKKALEPHRLDEDDLNSIKNHHWDYWCFPEDHELGDQEIKNKFPEEDIEVLANTSYIRNLPKKYSTSGIIDIKGKWTDLQDFGWRMINHPSPENDKSQRSWEIEQKKILSENSDKICVQIILHC